MRKYSRLIQIALALFLIVGMSLALGSTVQAQEGHVHDMSVACAGDDVEYIDLNDELEGLYDRQLEAYVISGGNYYLTDNLTLRYPLRIDGNGSRITVNLCLNGHKLSVKADSSKGILIINPATLNICDCYDGDERVHTITSPISGEDVTIEGGLITGADNNAAIYMSGTLNLYGGTIAGNKSDRDEGGSQGLSPVVVANGAFNMYGGEISHNIGGRAGGVWDQGCFTMTGGKIINNHCNNTSADDHPVGGVAVYLGEFHVSGRPEIRYNTGGEANMLTGEDPIDSNVAVYDSTDEDYDTWITVDGELSRRAQIGVTLVRWFPEESITGPFAEPGDGEIVLGDYMSAFFSDSGFSVAVETTGEKEGWLKLGPHHHPLCGARCEHEGEHTDIVEFEALNAAKLGELYNADDGVCFITTPADYYLSENLELDGPLMIYGDDSDITVNLCLNGYKITAREGAPAIVTDHGATLNICDCDGSKGEHQVDDPLEVYLDGDSDIDIYGGLITGAYDAPAIYMQGSTVITSDNAVNFYGGTIAGNDLAVDIMYTAEYEQDAPQLVFNMYGGEISYNKGGVNASGYNAVFNMHDGAISHNFNMDEYSAGGVAVREGAFFNMSGGEVSHNYGDDAGGVYVGDEFNYTSVFIMSGGTVSDNIGYYAGGVNIAVNSCFDMSSGQVSGNCGIYTGGVYVPLGSEFIMNGGQVSDNIGYLAGGVSVPRSGTVSVSGAPVIIDNELAEIDMTMIINIDAFIEAGKQAFVPIGQPCNVALAKIKIGENYLSSAITVKDELTGEDDSIGVSMLAEEGLFSPVLIPMDGHFARPKEETAPGYDNGYTIIDSDKEVFFSDYSGFDITKETEAGGNEGWLKLVKLPHIHPFCGAECTHPDGSGGFKHNTETDIATFIPLDAAELLKLSAGDYYIIHESANYVLTTNLKLAGPLVIMDMDKGDADPVTVNLCLNGHQLTAPEDADAELSTAIVVAYGATLNICDCFDEETHTGIAFDHTIDDPFYSFLEGADETVSIYGGLITGVQEGTAAIAVATMPGQGSSPGTVNFYGGTIAGNETVGVACMNMKAGDVPETEKPAAFNMYGGAISYNDGGVWAGGLGAEFNMYGAEFNMYGGEISHNLELYEEGGIHNPGNVSIIQGAVFNMHAGAIRHNASGSVGGVYLAGGSFNMSGGQISYNLGGGVGGLYIEDGSVSIQGDPVIRDNELIDQDKFGWNKVIVPTGQASNVALMCDDDRGAAYDPITITGALACADGSIGISLFEPGLDYFPDPVAGYFAKPKAETAPGTGDGYTPSASDMGKFFSDHGFSIEKEADSTSAFYNWLELVPHNHAICGGAACAHTQAHDDKDFFPLTQAESSKIERSGSYYLTADLPLDAILEITGEDTVVDLCLNGHRLIARADYPAIVTHGGATLNICDCGGGLPSGGHMINDDPATATPDDTVNIKTGLITGAQKLPAIWVGKPSSQSSTPGTVNFYGGTIAGNAFRGINLYECPVYVKDGEFNMYGGAISHNLCYEAGGVCVDGENSSFTMSGDATISGNTGYEAGGVYVDDGSFTMSGDATVSGNTAVMVGGVYVDDGSFTMSGKATVSNNKAVQMSGGVCVDGGSLTMSGDAKVSGNTSVMAGGVCVLDGIFTMRGGEIKNNMSFLSGVYIISSSFIISGDPVISGNQYKIYGQEAFDPEAFTPETLVIEDPDGERNVMLFEGDGTYIAVDGPLTRGAGIGVVLMEMEYTLGKFPTLTPIAGPIAKPATAGLDLDDYRVYFSSDVSDILKVWPVTSGEFNGGLKLDVGTPPPPPTPPTPTPGSGSGDSGGAPGVTIPVSSGEDSVEVSATLSGSQAKINITNEQLDKVVSGDDVGLVTVDVSELEKAKSAQLPASLIKAIADNDSAAGLEVILPGGSIEFDKNATQTLADNASSGGITIEIKEATNLTDEQKAAVGDDPVYEITAKGKNGLIHDLGGWATVTLPYDKEVEDGSLVQVFYLDADGNLHQVNAIYDAKTGTVSFKVDHLSLFVIKYASELAGWVNPYIDVAKGDWFYPYVRDLTMAGVVNGYPDATFRPKGTVTYGEALKLIMKAVGYEDQPGTAEHWAGGYMAKALADGLLDAAILDLNAPIDRLYVAEIAARALKLDMADVPASTPFADSDSYATLALYRAGIVEGSFNANGDRLYKPNDNITRAEITTIIWRINNTAGQDNTR